ncbi:Crp/Fnr family transcriptional regulator [Spirosoma soli]|uniref:Crp/Fnr family transcriptional regulator n=1 Tax=Spirosoma soli TaxID=1770529 RepID=A0ABW5LW87_9BACT
MIAVLEQHIRGRINPNDEQLASVLDHFTLVRVKRNQLLLRQGDVCRWCYFVAKGCVQVFTYDSNGDESTRDLVTENNWVTELFSFGNQLPANENLRAVEPGYLLAIGFDNFQKMVQTVPPFEQIYRQIIEQSYVNSVFRLNSFVAMDALERMQWMHAYQPKLLTRLSSKLIASYLGISPETYSRLKAKR